MKALHLAGALLGSIATVRADLILHYPFTESNPDATVPDASGNGNDGTLVGSPELAGSNGLRLDGVDDHVQLPGDLLRDLTALTVSTQVLIRSEQAGSYFIFGLGVTSNGDGNGYVFATGNPLRAAISPGNWEGEAESRSGDDLPRDVWKTVTYTLDSGSGEAALYLDGQKVADLTNGNPIIAPGTIGGGSTPNNYIGRSQYEADSYLAGSVRDFRVYDTALTEEEVQDLLPDEASRVESALAGLTITNAEDIRGNVHLPSSVDGFDLTWESSDTAVISADGIVTRQDNDAEVTLTASISHSSGTTDRSITTTVRAAVSLPPFEGYAFSYFTDNSVNGEKIFFAASEGNDALHWRELNGGGPVLASERGTTGLRDPFLIRSPEGDTFYLIATDLSIGSGTPWGDAVKFGSRYLEVWESHDLVEWSEQRHILVAPSTAGNTWAPEAFYDEEIGAYMVFWASSLYEEGDANRQGATYHRMMYATTRDFVTFSEAQVWQDAGMSRIDTTVIRDPEGTYFRFTKDEGAGGTGCTDIIQEKSSSLSGQMEEWEIVATCIGRDAGTQAVEGPTVFRGNEGDANGGGKYYLFVDEYSGRGYVPLETDDLGSPEWRVSENYELPGSPRHGTVIPVTAAELEYLVGTLG